MSTAEKYRRIEATGPISVVPLQSEALEGAKSRLFILMGPTGAGKSAFIESLTSDGSLSISKDSLESVTQEVICYQLLGVITKPEYGVRTYLLMDTPGFLDTKLSEPRITNMIIDKLGRLREMSTDMIIHICYLQPITDVRLGGSKRSAIKLLRGFAESFGGNNHIHVVTTMWNHVFTIKQTIDANRKLAALAGEIFLKSGRMNISLTKFDFTRDSALEFMDSATGTGFIIKSLHTHARASKYRSTQRENLLGRISSSYQQLQFLAEERKNVAFSGEEGYILLQYIQRDEQAALQALQYALDDLFDLDPDSASTPFTIRRPIIQDQPPQVQTSVSPSPPKSPGRSVRHRLKRFVESIEGVLHKK